MAVEGLIALAQIEARGGLPRVDMVWLLIGCLPLVAAVIYAATARQQVYLQRQVIDANASTSHEWLWQSDAQDRITYSNDAVTALLGYRPEELVGQPTSELLYDETEQVRMGRVRDSMRAGDGSWRDLVLVWRHADGARVRMQGSAVLLHDRRGNVVGFRGTRRLIEDPAAEQERVLADRGRLVDVLSTQEVDIALQPIVNLTSGRTIGVEALARFRDGRPPAVWFAEAERCGYARELDEMTFFAALPLLGSLPATWHMSINASPELLLDPAFRERALGCGLPLDRLVIEITEHVCVADYEALKEALAPLRASGIRFAIDDTGAGYASLNHVLQLTPDIIKLDRTLLTHLETDRARRSLITALVLLALDIGATVTGEGVESVDQRETLNLLGVDHAQGYLFSAPTIDARNWVAWRQQWWVPDHLSARSPQLPQRQARTSLG
jgi:PAS domain S-box-containing protein